MEIVLEASLVCETPTYTDYNSDTDEAPGQISSSPTHIAPQKKKPENKKPRQWAAWTSHEEESFFSALRQCGKNFEKITHRVQSKNKDQVRHYYYRLVRRMNKLLDPEFSLDAKNTKETIAAMLRWWSLLEKYSCKASRLHLKPRIFKTFLGALEDQLLKDRKRNIKKRHARENYTPSSLTLSSQSKGSGNHNRATKPILRDIKNIQKSGHGKSSLLKRNSNLGVKCNSSKGNTSFGKTMKQPKKTTGHVSSSAFKRWEKAALAGVSLVADAAEHLERTATDNEVEHDQGETVFNPASKNLPPLPNSAHNRFAEGNVQSSSKLKLQLFPIDEATRIALEMDKHNPHLELTLSTRKKIFSVLEHLNRKWGDSSVASGDLMLFPYSVEKENMGCCNRWGQCSLASASDVYSMIGSPTIFRMRYGWISMTNLNPTTHQEKFDDSVSMPAQLPDHQCKNLADSLKDKTSEIENTLHLESSIGPCTHNKVAQLEKSDELSINHATTMSIGSWADTLTNISVGDLLSDVSDNMKANPSVSGTSVYHQQISFTCDSFDAAIAALMPTHQNRTVIEPVLTSSASSIWEAEETCDAFFFRKKQVKNSVNSGGMVEEALNIKGPNNDSAHECPVDEYHSASHANVDTDFDGLLTDISWPDSLGPLEMDRPPSRYQCNDLILSESLTDLNRLIASSVDELQNCSFFGAENKEKTSIEACKTASFSDFKIGGV